MAEHLTALDATFLELEEADETAHMHVGAALVFDELPTGGAPSLAQLRVELEGRLEHLPRYREKLSELHTGGLGWPEWVPDGSFDIARHVRRAAVPAPGGREELLEFCADFWSHRLDRRHPLWEAVLLEGLEDGRWALLTKTHHCMVDGIGSADAAQVLLDDSPDGPLDRAPAAIPETRTQNGSLVLSLARTVLHPRSAAHNARLVLDVLLKDEVIAAPKSALNVPIGTSRRFDATSFALEDVRIIRRELGGTVNDVVLAAATGGLRKLLLARDDDVPERGLRAMVPVNVRPESEYGKLGNWVSSLFVHLPVVEPDPLRRLRLIQGAVGELKTGEQALGGQLLVGLTSLAPPAVHSFAARSLFASRLFNVTVTNVPGPQLPLYAFGARLREVHPLVPLAAEHAVGIAVCSYDGRLYFGLIADRDEVPELAQLRIGIDESLAELLALAGAPAKEEVIS